MLKIAIKPILLRNPRNSDRLTHCVRRGLNGFTLIELLVVISIIAILSAMLLPAIGLVRFSANGTVCVNRQKQTAIGIFTYANDNDNEMPYVALGYYDYYQGKQRNESPGMNCSTSVNGMIYPYVGTMSIALCPANKNQDPSNVPTWGGHSLPCPDPTTCNGRSNSYGAWMGNDTNRSTNIMDETHGCPLSQYINRMKRSRLGDPGPDQINRFTGLTVSGAPAGRSTWAEAWGSTMLVELWPGQHKQGSRRGSALINIDGAGLFRTYDQSQIGVPPYRQFDRYELE